MFKIHIILFIDLIKGKESIEETLGAIIDNIKLKQIEMHIN